MPEKVWHLKEFRLFEQLSPEQLARIEAHARMRHFARKSLVYLPGDAAEAVLLVVSGRVKICNFTADGKQSILTFIEPGEVFGELAALDDVPHEEYAEVVEPATIVLIPRDEMRRLMEETPIWTVALTRLFGLRRRRIERRLRNLLYRNNRERLVHLLLELAEQYGHEWAGGVQLDVPLSHQDLASLIGSTRESTTVALGELVNEGYVQLARRRVFIRDLAGLAASVDTTAPEVGVPP
ncbi:MAG: Crp/Fnr family transcriptional regulator [Planctomycetales bacterium]|nr:Crp/Fnr family transcriptional regulator [Planctomycetales bacterium]